MKKTDVAIFADRAYLVVEVLDDRVRLRKLAGPDSEPATTTLPLVHLQGRPIYRRVSAIDDVDIDLAAEEVKTDLDISDFGDDPRKWTDAFSRIHASRVTPDMTIMLGWFAEAIASGRAEGKRTALLEIAEQKRLQARKAAAAKKQREKEQAKKDSPAVKGRRDPPRKLAATKESK